MKGDKFEDFNAYASPMHMESKVPVPMPMSTNSVFVRQVKPLCVCMIIQGVLEILLGIMYGGLGFVAFAQPVAVGVQVSMQEQIIGMLVYIILGSIAFVAGVLRIAAGIRGFNFRGYKLGVASHFFGMFNLLTCVCIPTSLALCIWGCIVYFSSEVKYAFQMGAEGHDAREIEAGTSGRFGG